MRYALRRARFGSGRQPDIGIRASGRMQTRRLVAALLATPCELRFSSIQPWSKHGAGVQEHHPVRAALPGAGREGCGMRSPRNAGMAAATSATRSITPLARAVQPAPAAPHAAVGAAPGGEGREWQGCFDPSVGMITSIRR